MTLFRLKKLKNSEGFRKLFALLLLVFALIQFLYNLFRIPSRGGDNWGTGEWLINYGGGFIRRGFFGEILLNLPFTGAHTLWALIVFQSWLFLMIWVYFVKTLARLNYEWPYIAIICSPFSLCFLAWDRYLYARKELLGIAILVLIAYKITYKSYSGKFFLVLIHVLYTIAVFSSEVNLTLLPGMIYLISVYCKKTIDLFHGFVLVAISLLAVLVSLIYSGDKSASKSICKKIINDQLDESSNCMGAVSIIGMPIHEMVSILIGSYPASFAYLLIGLIALLPLILSSWITQNFLWFYFMVLGVLPLFLIGWDYGRWIFILTMEITICLTLTKNTFSNRFFSSPINTVVYTFAIGTGHTGDPLKNGWVSSFSSLLRRIINF
jgi:hypothetical protein